MKKALVTGTLLLLTAGAAGWYLLKGQPAAMPSTEATSKQQQAKPLDPTKYDFFDVDFAQKMILHHQQGVEIADTVLASTANQDIRSMATEMRSKQAKAESQYILWMDEWNEKYKNLTDFPQMDGHDMYPSYPGLISAAKLGLLKSASSTEQDALFIELMIEHHSGGIQTSKQSNKLQYGKLIEYKDRVFADYAVELEEMRKV